MTKTEVVEGLKLYNEWRRGADIEMLDPKKIGIIIDAAIEMLKTNE